LKFTLKPILVHHSLSDYQHSEWSTNATKHSHGPSVGPHM